MPDDVTLTTEAPPRTDQKPKAFRISTALGVGKGQDETDPLLVAQINGSEAVSSPFSFELTVLRRSTEDDGSPRPPVDPRDLINTQVTFGISTARNNGQFFDWVERHGTIDHFEELADSPGEGFRCYAMRVVPALRLLERERTFRIFEDMDVLAVIRAVFQAQGDIPADYLILKMEDSKFAPMPYCVQFGEDSLAFVSRLMATFGLWYFFTHDHDRQSERMVLGRGRLRFPRDAALLFRADSPEAEQVSGYRRIFSTAPKRVNVGEFNPLDPTKPYHGSEKIAENYDIAVKNNVHTPGRFQHRIFPGSFLSNDELHTEASKRMESGESLVFTATGQSKHRDLRAGEAVIVFPEGGGAGGLKTVVTTLSIHGIDLNFGHSVRNIGEFFKVLYKGLNPFGDGKITDISATIAQSEAGDFLLKGASSLLRTASSVGSVVPYANVVLKLPDVVGSVAAATSSVNDAAKKFMDGPTGGVDFGNSFVGVSQADSEDDSYLLSPPAAQKPVARGPHPAVVIGPDGTRTNGGSEIFADALGRVRVRFPWEPRDESGDPLAEPPFDSGRNSAWLRVSEGWAGRGWGIQFLPRIGQEVLVDFLDGDPERPIIVGRLYNATSGHTNLPFPSKNASIAKKPLNKLDDLKDTAGHLLPRSGIKTRTTPLATGARERFHLLRFDDDPQHEQYLMRSQGRMDVTAFASYFDTTYGSRHLTIGGKKTAPAPREIGGDYIAKVFRDYHLHIGDPDFPGDSGNRITLVEQDEQIHVGEDLNQQIDGDWSTSVGGTMSVSAGGPTSPGTIVLTATANITLQVGASTIVLTPAGIAINAPLVTLQMGPVPGKPAVATAPIVNRPKDPTPADPGEEK